jgi:hypothetical protein
MKRFVSRILISTLVAGAILSIALVFLGGGHSIESVKTPQPVSLLSPDTVPNVTAAVVGSIAKTIADKNPDGPIFSTSTGRITFNTQEVIANAVEKARQKAQGDPLTPTITQEMLIVSADTSPDSQRAYLKTLSTIIDTHMKNSLINTTNPQASNFESLAQTRQKAFDEIIALSVPRPLLTYHQRFLTILGTQRNIFALLARSDEDPVRSVWAAQAGPVVFSDAVDLTRDLQEYISAQHL